jgi:cob(I)alamin adenosyltransferase
MKIYTKTGDEGNTSLLGGTRVPKNHLRIEAYGSIDELNSYIGLIRSYDINEVHKTTLFDIQHHLFVIGSILASDPSKSNIKIPSISSDEVVFLEHQIDWMNERLPELKNFVLPGGNQVASHCHIARCICRRTERLVVGLNADSKVDDIILQFLNRLSDYLFVLSRKLCYEHNVEEVLWITRS